MNDRLILMLAWLCGAGLGTFFFGGLWWTIRKALVARQPVVWFLGSFLLRTNLTLAGLYLASANRWERLLACLLGFLMARLVLARLTRPAPEPTPHLTHEARHAP